MCTILRGFADSGFSGAVHQLVHLAQCAGFYQDMKGYREKASESSLAAMSHSVALPAGVSAAQASAYLRSQGFGARGQPRRRWRAGGGQKGAANKLGYFLAHIALVVICLGGLLDGNVPLKVAELFGKVVPETRDIPQSQIPPQSRLSTSNLSFRGNVTIPENSSADVVFLNAGNGYFVQDLPFAVTLKNSMGLLQHRHAQAVRQRSGGDRQANWQRNRGHGEGEPPLIIDGVAIYQASFGDGGSPLRFKAWNLGTLQRRRKPWRPKSLGSQPVGNQWPALPAGSRRAAHLQYRERRRQ